MSTHDKRLDRLSLVYRRLEPAPLSDYDYSGLSSQAQYELDRLLRWDEPHNAADVPDRPMTAVEEGRLTELLARLTYRSPRYEQGGM